MVKLTNFNCDLVRYIIPSYKLNRCEDINVVLIADLHGYTKNRKKSLLLGEEIKKLNPHHVIIAGDIMQGDEWEDLKAINDFEYFLDNLSESMHVFMKPGNHDSIGNNSDNHERRIANFRDLERKNVYPLVNDIEIYDGFQIAGFMPSIKLLHNSFTMSNDLLQKHFIEEVNEKMSISNSEKYINEFIGHNPHMIMGKSLGVLDGFNTFYSGHLHNGYYSSKRTKKYPDKYLDYGYNEKPYEIDDNGKLLGINPFLITKTSLCRGCIFFDGNTKYLVLRNGHYYYNVDNKWYPVYPYDAIKDILDKKLKSLVITGGIKKFSYFSDLIDIPEVTMVTYEKKEKILIK